MKFDVPNKSRAPQLALTSMLDVIFLLLCFFGFSPSAPALAADANLTR